MIVPFLILQEGVGVCFVAKRCGEKCGGNLGVGCRGKDIDVLVGKHTGLCVSCLVFLLFFAMFVHNLFTTLFITLFTRVFTTCSPHLFSNGQQNHLLGLVGPRA